LHNPLITFPNSERKVLLGMWFIVFQYIYIIYSAVFVAENVVFLKSEFSLTQPHLAAR
jgi:hypothetical protein